MGSRQATRRRRRTSSRRRDPECIARWGPVPVQTDPCDRPRRQDRVLAPTRLGVTRSPLRDVCSAGFEDHTQRHHGQVLTGRNVIWTIVRPAHRCRGDLRVEAHCPGLQCLAQAELARQDRADDVHYRVAIAKRTTPHRRLGELRPPEARRCSRHRPKCRKQFHWHAARRDANDVWMRRVRPWISDDHQDPRRLLDERRSATPVLNNEGNREAMGRPEFHRIHVRTNGLPTNGRNEPDRNGSRSHALVFADRQSGRSTVHSPQPACLR